MRNVSLLACVVGMSLVLEGFSDRPRSIRHARRGPVDVVHYKPGDVGYAFNPDTDRQSRLRADSSTASIVVTYDANFVANPAARDAFQAAVDIWATIVSSSVPIRVRAFFKPLPFGVLGSAGPTVICDTAADPDTFYAAALADKLNGEQTCAAGLLPNPETHEIEANFSTTFAA